MNTLKFSQDFYRYFGRECKNKDILKVIFNHELRFNYFFRKYQNSNNKFLKLFYKIFIRQIRLKYGIEISPNTKIGKGFYMGHPFDITINPNVILGENVNIHKGVTIGQENRGERKGTPIISNKVWIGVNSTIVGRIKIGNNVLIAPNTYVNRDIPDNSIVVGNPCKIIENIEATKDYINNIV